jgi:hypothetical protein
MCWLIDILTGARVVIRYAQNLSARIEASRQRAEPLSSELLHAFELAWSYAVTIATTNDQWYQIIPDAFWDGLESYLTLRDKGNEDPSIRYSSRVELQSALNGLLKRTTGWDGRALRLKVISLVDLFLNQSYASQQRTRTISLHHTHKYLLEHVKEHRPDTRIVVT